MILSYSNEYGASYSNLSQLVGVVTSYLSNLQVFVGDQVVFESVKSPGQYMHVSRGTFPSTYVYSDSHELSLSVRQSGFSIVRQRKPVSTHRPSFTCCFGWFGRGWSYTYFYSKVSCK